MSHAHIYCGAVPPEGQATWAQMDIENSGEDPDPRVCEEDESVLRRILANPSFFRAEVPHSYASPKEGWESKRNR